MGTESHYDNLRFTQKILWVQEKWKIYLHKNQDTSSAQATAIHPPWDISHEAVISGCSAVCGCSVFLDTALVQHDLLSIMSTGIIFSLNGYVKISINYEKSAVRETGLNNFIINNGKSVEYYLRL